MYLGICINIFWFVHLCASVRVRARARVCVCVCVCVRARARTHAHSQMLCAAYKDIKVQINQKKYRTIQPRSIRMQIRTTDSMNSVQCNVIHIIKYYNCTDNFFIFFISIIFLRIYHIWPKVIIDYRQKLKVHPQLRNIICKQNGILWKGLGCGYSSRTVFCNKTHWTRQNESGPKRFHCSVALIC